MRLLAQYAFFLQSFTVRACGFSQFKADEQPASADVFDPVIIDLQKLRLEVFSEFMGFFDQILIDQDIERRFRHRTCTRTSAECGTVRAGIEHTEYLAVRKHAGNREHPAAERLAEDVHIRYDLVPVRCEKLARTAEARLDLISDEQYIMLVAHFPDLFQETFRRY